MSIFRKGTIKPIQEDVQPLPEPLPAPSNEPEPLPEPLPDESEEWMKIARAELGQAEVKGKKSNPRILKYHLAANGEAPDEIPWCSSFVNWVLQKADYKITKSKRAASWLKYGIELKQPRPGCLVVFKRDAGHHVAFFCGFTNDGQVLVLGGNQKNKVCEAAYSLKILSFRWPVKK